VTAVGWGRRRFARLATNAVLANPALWRLFRAPVRRLFQDLAPVWDGMRSPEALLGGYEAGLAALPEAPRRVLDLGTGTGLGAFAVARRFPAAEVTGVDLAPGMIDEAQRRTPSELGARVGFRVADAAALPFEDGAFDLVTLGNMIPFWDELARVVAPGGAALFVASQGAGTPIYVSPDRIRLELGRRGFPQIADFSAPPASAVLARKG
jgi:SAM-dependent methyltransferase